MIILTTRLPNCSTPSHNFAPNTLRSLSLFLSILSGYKLFHFAQAQKGLKLNISQVCLACEVLTNILRFLWAAIDPFHGARKVLTWGFLRWLFRRTWQLIPSASS
jgi:hypothetical protein